MYHNVFEPEHDTCRQSVRAFLQKQVVPHYNKRGRDGIVAREVFTQAADAKGE